VLPENARHSGSRKPESHADIEAVEKLLQSHKYPQNTK